MRLSGLRRVVVQAAAFAAALLAAPSFSVAGGDSGSPSVIAASYPPATAANQTASPVSLGRPVPVATLGRPLPLAGVAGNPASGAPSTPPPPPSPSGVVSDRALAPVSYQAAGSPPTVTVRSQSPDVPPPLSGPTPFVAAQVPPPISAGEVPPPPSLGAPGATYAGVPVDQPIQKSFWDKCKDVFSSGNPDSRCGGWCQSDHAFDSCVCGGDLISPVTMPFYFEDPRSLTEVRPIFIYQTAPNHNPAFGGGSSEFYGIQARLAINNCWSIVLHELGIVSIQPHDSNVGLTDQAGFAELKVGPKWTFYRNEQAGAVAAFGTMFEIPTGNKSVFQNTGSLSLDPYLSYGKTFGRSSYGTFNFMSNVGYSFSIDDKRTDFIHTHMHLDYDVANLHRIYPLIELNWLHTTSFGKANENIGTEGGDLINFGSTSYDGKRDLVTLAVGARYKFGSSDHYQVGSAFEFPLTDRKDLQAFRFTLDFIIRY